MVKENKRKRGASKKSRQHPGDLESFLSTKEAIQALGAAMVSHRRRELAKRKKVIARRVPSSSWLDAVWYESAPFPPAWDHPRVDPLKEPPATAMKVCRACHRDTPPQCIGSSGHCEDCKYGAMTPAQLAKLPGSSSAINLAKLKAAARCGREYRGGF